MKILVLPHTMGGDLYRVSPETLETDVDADRLAEISGGAFSDVVFPSMPCHVWKVTKVS